MSRTLSILGVAITVVYLGILWFIFDGRLTEILMMPPNEIGDLLAGMFGPLAILWLILGFFQQGIELRQNTNALKLQEKALQAQVDELHNSVQQQKELVDVAKRQLEEARDAWVQEMQEKMDSQKPVFVLLEVFSPFDQHIASGKGLDDHDWIGKPQYVAKFRNIGGAAKQVRVQFPSGFSLDRAVRSVVSHVLHGEIMELSFNVGRGFRAGMKTDGKPIVALKYEDVRGLSRVQNFDFPIDNLLL
jgi:hypothetical protein